MTTARLDCFLDDLRGEVQGLNDALETFVRAAASSILVGRIAIPIQAVVVKRVPTLQRLSKHCP